MRKMMEKLQITKFKKKIKKTMMIIKQQSVKALLITPSAKALQIEHTLKIMTMKMQLTSKMQIELRTMMKKSANRIDQEVRPENRTIGRKVSFKRI